MKSLTKLRISTWLLTMVVIAISITAWFPSAHPLTTYRLFPLLGLIAFGLMWTHYVSGAVRGYLRLPRDSLHTHVKVTGYVVLFCIVMHPFLLEFQLYLDGLGLPPGSLFVVYTSLAERLALLWATVALAAFLLYEAHRVYASRRWWRYVEWANIAAMILILVHGFTLGSTLRVPWFQAVWYLYAASFIASVAYTGYYKRRNPYGDKRKT